MQAVIFNEDELRAKCAEWQKILRLQDWIVVPKILRARDMDLEGCAGECSWQLQKRMAAIHVIDPVDHPPDLLEEYDMELTLVHELLHLHFAPLHDSDGDNLEEEQAIEAISRGLIALKRMGEGKVVEVPQGHPFTFKSSHANIEAEGPATIIFRDESEVFSSE